MKKFKLILLLSILVVLGAKAADKYIFSDSYTLSGTKTINVSTTTKPYYLTSVLLTYPSAVDTVFTVAYVRNDVTNVLLSTTATNFTSLVWYIPGRVYVKRGDQWRFSSTNVMSGTLTLNAEF